MLEQAFIRQTLGVTLKIQMMVVLLVIKDRKKKNNNRGTKQPGYSSDGTFDNPGAIIKPKGKEPTLPISGVYYSKKQSLANHK